MFEPINRTRIRPLCCCLSCKISATRFNTLGLIDTVIRQRLNMPKKIKFILFHRGPRYIEKVTYKPIIPIIKPAILKLDSSILWSLNKLCEANKFCYCLFRSFNLKYSKVFFNPLSSSNFGVNPSMRLAFEISE